MKAPGDKARVRLGYMDGVEGRQGHQAQLEVKAD